MNILIIDDEINICLTLKTILEDEGYNCFHSLSDKQGLKLFEDISPEIVLLDVKLDNANGLDVLKNIKQAKQKLMHSLKKLKLMKFSYKLRKLLPTGD